MSSMAPQYQNKHRVVRRLGWEDTVHNRSFVPLQLLLWPQCYHFTPEQCSQWSPQCQGTLAQSNTKKKRHHWAVSLQRSLLSIRKCKISQKIPILKSFEIIYSISNLQVNKIFPWFHENDITSQFVIVDKLDFVPNKFKTNAYGQPYEHRFCCNFFGVDSTPLCLN